MVSGGAGRGPDSALGASGGAACQRAARALSATEEAPAFRLRAPLSAHPDTAALQRGRGRFDRGRLTQRAPLIVKLSMPGMTGLKRLPFSVQFWCVSGNW